MTCIDTADQNERAAIKSVTIPTSNVRVGYLWFRPYSNCILVTQDKTHVSL